MIFFFLLDSMIASAAIPPTPFPVFLKQGFSAVLEFETSPKRVVLGDPQTFQVEKMEKSLVIRPLSAYASTNMFVYFESNDPKLFLLKAAEDAEPTLYRKMESLKLPEPNSSVKIAAAGKPTTRGLRLLSAKFDEKKDYLTLDLEISASGDQKIVPAWALSRLRYKDAAVIPGKLWAERKEVMRDSKVKARVTFAKPNVPKNLRGASFVLPLEGGDPALTVSLGGK